MAQNSVVVIDGSNIATEGRSLPSLAQLDEAVRSFLEEFPHDQFIVVVDATFEHRIDPSERRMYDDALAANELLTPPAGTIGRGDAFILAIAEKADATVFSNDSFQEFHGEFDWLFEEGRLIGGKPVPVIGWVFTARTPVRGQKSRQATREATKRRSRGGTKATSTGPRAVTRRPASSPAANLPMPTPKAPPPRPARSAEADVTQDESSGAGGSGGRSERSRRSSRKRTAAPAREPVNEGLAFVTFISEHAVGETVEGEVTEFSSHGAYVAVGETRCYVPLKYLGNPPPRAARDVLERSEMRSFVVQAIDGPRRAVDLALPGFEQLDGANDVAEGVDEDDEPARTAQPEPAPRRRTRKKAAATVAVGDVPAASSSEGEEAEPAPRRRSRKKAAVTVGDVLAASPSEGEEAEPAPRRRSRKKAAVVLEEPASEDLTSAQPEVPRGRGRKVPAPPPVDGRPVDDALPSGTSVDERASGEATQVTTRRSTSRKAPAKKAAAKTSAAQRSAAVTASAEHTAADQASTEEATAEAKEAPTKKAASSRKAPTKKAPSKAPTKKATSTKATATKDDAAKKATAKNAAPKKATAKKATAKKATAKKAPAGGTVAAEGTGEAAPPRKRVTKKAASTSSEEDAAG